MKCCVLASAVLLVLTAGPLAFGEIPEIDPAVFVQDGGADLKVNLYSNPTAVDWNNDGAKDLVVGQIMYGYIVLYLNQGTNLNPKFSGGSFVQSGGSNIAVSWG